MKKHNEFSLVIILVIMIARIHKKLIHIFVQYNKLCITIQLKPSKYML